MKNEMYNKFISFNAPPSHFVGTEPGRYQTEQVSDGIYLKTNSQLLYLKNDGNVYKLLAEDNSDIIRFHELLYNKSLQCNDCNIEIPVNSSVFTINEKIYTYSHSKRTFDNIGADWVLDVCNNVVDTNYMIDKIDKITVFLKYMKYMSSNGFYFLPRLPKMVSYENDYCWIDFKTLGIDYEDMKTEYLKHIKHSIARFNLMCNIKVDDKTIIKYALASWK